MSRLVPHAAGPAVAGILFPGLSSGPVYVFAAEEATDGGWCSVDLNNRTETRSGGFELRAHREFEIVGPMCSPQAGIPHRTVCGAVRLGQCVSAAARRREYLAAPVVWVIMT